MIAVPAVMIFDQLTSYVRVSPGWNARMCVGRETAVGISSLKTPEMGTNPKVRMHRAAKFRKAVRDAIFFKGSCIEKAYPDFGS
jgi:hypothetical protein